MDGNNQIKAMRWYMKSEWYKKDYFPTNISQLTKILQEYGNFLLKEQVKKERKNKLHRLQSNCLVQNPYKLKKIKMETIRLTFYECEHNGDIRKYSDDMIKCGAKIIDTYVDPNSEIGDIIAEVENYEQFKLLFAETESVDFCQSGI